MSDARAMLPCQRPAKRLRVVVIGDDDAPLGHIAVVVRQNGRYQRDVTDLAGECEFHDLHEEAPAQITLANIDQDAWETTARHKLRPDLVESTRGVNWSDDDLPDKPSCQHTVGEFDCLLRIGFEYGFLPETLWSHPPNTSKWQKHDQKNVLPIGQIVEIPALRRRWEDVTLDTAQVIHRVGIPVLTEVRLLGAQQKPVANSPFVLSLEHEDRRPRPYRHGFTDFDGVLRFWVMPDVISGRAVVTRPDKAKRWLLDFSLGNLRPVSDPKGVRARLLNLGYQDESAPADDDSALVDFLAHKATPDATEDQAASLLADAASAEDATGEKGLIRTEEVHDEVILETTHPAKVTLAIDGGSAVLAEPAQFDVFLWNVCDLGGGPSGRKACRDGDIIDATAQIIFEAKCHFVGILELKRSGGSRKKPVEAQSRGKYDDPFASFLNLEKYPERDVSNDADARLHFREIVCSFLFDVVEHLLWLPRLAPQDAEKDGASTSDQILNKIIDKIGKLPDSGSGLGTDTKSGEEKEASRVKTRETITRHVKTFAQSLVNHEWIAKNLSGKISLSGRKQSTLSELLDELRDLEFLEWSAVSTDSSTWPKSKNKSADSKTKKPKVDTPFKKAKDSFKKQEDLCGNSICSARVELLYKGGEPLQYLVNCLEFIEMWRKSTADIEKIFLL